MRDRTFRDLAVIVIGATEAYEAIRPLPLWQKLQATHPANPKKRGQKPRPHMKDGRK